MAKYRPWLVLVLLVASACEVSLGNPPEGNTGQTSVVTSSTTTSTTRPAATVTTAVKLDPKDVRVMTAAAILQSTPLELSLAVWAAQTVLAAGEAEHYETVEAMTRHASAVVVGQVLGQGPVRRMIRGGRAVVFESLQVEVLYALAGTRHLEPGDQVRVEMLAAPDDAKGRAAVLFLRCNQDDTDGNVDPNVPAYEAGVYRLVGSQGVFVDRGDGVPVNPITEAMRLTINGDHNELRLDQFILSDDVPKREEQPVAAQARGLSMTDFLQIIIAAGSRTVGAPPPTDAGASGSE